jgi:serine/threonine protein kinase
VVREFVGRGSFGTVYKVEESATRKIFAVKTLSTGSQGEHDMASFFNEGRLAVGIRHPNVIEYEYFHDGSEHKDLPPYILMQYASGGSLLALLREAYSTQKPFSNDALLAMFHQLISGIQAINAVLVHRDIKPGNIVVHDSVLKITDFGLAKLVSEATRAMTFKGAVHILIWLRKHGAMIRTPLP